MARRIKTNTTKANFKSNLDIVPDDGSSFVENKEATLDMPEDNLVDINALSKQIALAAEESLKKESLLEEKDQISKTEENDDSFFSDSFLAEKENMAIEAFLPDHNFSEDLSMINESLVDDSLKDHSLPRHLRPANDDRTGFMRHLYVKKSPSKLYRNTSALSGLWALGGFTIAETFSPAGSSFSSLFSSPFGLSVLAGTTVPIMLFWGFAKLTKSAKEEIENVAQAAAQAALNSAKPQKTSKEVEAIELGDSVRKEVAAMGHVIERTLERGAELEALVHGEVQNLERAYGENESRIHKLINELSSERTAILEHAERINASLQNTRASLSQELGNITEDIAHNVTNIAKALSDTLENKSNAIFVNLQKVSHNIAEQIAYKLEETAETSAQTNQKLISALNQQLNDAQQNFKKNSAEFFKDFQEQIVYSESMAEKIGSQFHNTVDKVADDFNKILHKIDSSIDDHGQKSLTFLDKKIAYFDKETDKVLSTLGEKFENLDSHLLERSQKTLELFEEKSAKISQSSVSMSENFDKAAGETIQILEQRVNEIDALIGKQNKSVSHSIIEHTQTLEENANKLVTMLDERVSTINENLSSHTSSLADMFTFGHNGFFAVIDEIKGRIHNEIEKVEASIGRLFHDRSEDLSSRLLESREQLSQAIQNEILNISDTVQDKIDLLSSHISNIEHSLVSSVSSIDSHVNTLDSRTSDLTNSLTNSFEVIKESLDQQAENINIRAESLRDSLSINSFELNKTLSDQAYLLEERVERIRELVARGGVEFNDVITKQFSDFETMLSTNGNKLTTSFAEHLDVLHSYAEQIQTAIEHSTQAKIELDSRTEQIGQAFGAQIALIDERTNMVQKTLDYGVDNVRASLEQSALALAGSLRQRIEEAAQFFSVEAKKAETIVDTIEHKLHSSVHDFESNLSLVQDNISNGTAVIAENVKEKISQINAYVFSEADQTSQKILEAGHYVVSSLSKTSNDLTENLTNFSQDLDHKINQRSLTIEHSVDLLEEKIKNRIEEVGKKIGDLNNYNASQISAQIDQLAHVSQNVCNAVAETNTSLYQVSEQFARNAQLTQEKFSYENQNFINALAQKTDETVEAVSSIGGALTNTVNNLLSQLNSSVNNIDQSAKTLIKNVESFDGNFSEKVNSFAQNAEQLSENIVSSTNHISQGIHSMKLVSSQTAQNLNELINRFNEHAGVLGNAAELFDHAQNNFATTLSDRQNALTTLSQSIEKKSKEIAQAILHYEQIVSNALENTQQKTSNSVNEIEKDLSRLISDASSRFMDATQLIHETTQTMRSEMEQATKHYGENSYAIPERTKRTSSIMRHAIEEQVQALKDLANVANVPGACLDLSDRNTQNSVSFAKDPLNTQQVSKEKGWVSSLLDRASKSDDNSYALAKENAMQNTQDFAASLSKPSFMKPNFFSSKDPKTASQSPFMDPIFNKNGSNPFEKNFKGSSSQNNRDSSPLDSFAFNAQADTVSLKGDADVKMETLKELSRDIIKAINHEAIVELWTHYRRGQKNIDPKRLYTPQGLMVLERVKRNYALNPAFCVSANRYIEDFERALQNVSKNNTKQNTIIRDHLTSDMGKVYTMLAHVNHRIS